MSDRHRRWVANHFAEKVEELHYQLAAVVDACDRSLLLFASAQQVPSGNRKAVVFSFSSFTNVVQTLKDAAGTVTGETLSWSRIEKLRHGSFMHHARNAATHDGHPVIDSWVDGRYFVASKIVRLNNRHEVIEMAAPRQDIRTLCLEFSVDFCRLMIKALSGTRELTRLRGPLVDMPELEEAVRESQVIPEFAKQLFEGNRHKVSEMLAADSRNPVALAIARIEEVIRYTESAAM